MVLCLQVRNASDEYLLQQHFISLQLHLTINLTFKNAYQLNGDLILDLFKNDADQLNFRLNAQCNIMVMYKTWKFGNEVYLFNFSLTV